MALGGPKNLDPALGSKSLKTIALESSDDEYSDSKSDELNNVIAYIQNKQDSSDSNDECTGQEAPINTDNNNNNNNYLPNAQT